MKRTIASARLALAEDFSRQPDWWQRKAQAALVEAEKAANEYATGFLDRMTPEIEGVVVEATQELTEVRDALDDLRREASDGRMPAPTYAQKLAELRDRQTRAEVALEDAEDRVEDLAKIEEAPIEWFDAQSERFTHLQRTFPW